MSTHFISDLHLSGERPKVLSRFLAYLVERASQADRLYILGDLFDVWVGDDDRAEPIPLVTEALARLADNNVKVRLLHGNRDFLIGDAFASACGVEMVADPLVIEDDGVTTLLMHGDLLCTDDTTYQQARLYLRDPATIADFLAKPLDERRQLAAAYRSQSGEATSLKAEDIMDVNRHTVVEYLKKYSARRLIHGHTHRPGRHKVAWDDGTATRYVLPEWVDGGGGYLELVDGKLVSGVC